MSWLMQARQHVTSAQGALKTSLFKWSPDYMLAGHEYDKAAAAFRSAGMLAESADAAESAAENHGKAGNGGEVAAARSLEKGGDTLLEHAKEKDDSSAAERAAVMYGKAKMLFAEIGEASKAAGCESNRGKALSTAGMLLAEGDPRRNSLLEQALEAFLSACAILEESNRVAFSLDTFRTALNQSVQLGRWADALRVCDRMMGPLETLKQTSALHKMVLSKIVINLKRNDYTAARNVFLSSFDLGNDYARSEECRASEDILKAWEAQDEEEIAQVLKRPVFNFLERQVCVAAYSLNPFSATSKPSASSFPVASSVPYAAAAALKADEPAKIEYGKDSAKAELFRKPTPAPAQVPAVVPSPPVSASVPSLATQATEEETRDIDEQHPPASALPDPTPAQIIHVDEDDSSLDMLR